MFILTKIFYNSEMLIRLCTINRLFTKKSVVGTLNRSRDSTSTADLYLVRTCSINVEIKEINV